MKEYAFSASDWFLLSLLLPEEFINMMSERLGTPTTLPLPPLLPLLLTLILLVIIFFEGVSIAMCSCGRKLEQSAGGTKSECTKSEEELLLIVEFWEDIIVNTATTAAAMMRKNKMND